MTVWTCGPEHRRRAGINVGNQAGPDRGLDAVTDFAVQIPLTRCGGWRHVPTTANGQPAVGCYRWNDDAGAHLGWSIDVLTLRGEHIAEVTSFVGSEHLVLLGLPAVT